MKRALFAACTALGLVCGLHQPSALACHEAVVGPHASFLYGAPNYLSLQTFQVSQGSGDEASSQTVSALSLGVTPIRDLPLSVAIVQPFSLVDSLEKHAAHDHSHKELGVEDSIVALGWRFSLPSAGPGPSGHGNFAAVMVGADLPTGNVDHEAGEGPADMLLSGIISLEFGALSTVAYAHHQLNGFDRRGSKLGDESFAGAGVGWTFLEGGRGTHLAAQLGVGWERTGARVIDSVDVPDSGGWALLAQPTVVWGPNDRWRVFASFGAPIAQDFAKATDESGWRAGLGVVWMLGNPSGEKATGCGSAGCASPGGCDEGCTNPASTTGCGSCGEGPTAKSTECEGCARPAVDAPASPGCASCAGEPAAKGSGCVDCAAPSPPSPCACEG